MKAALLTLALLLAGHAPAAHAQIPLPQFEARVTDLTGTLTAAQQSALEEKLAAFEARKGAQIAVLILPTTEPEDIAQFGIRLAEAWKLGRAAPDDGAILIVAKDDRAMRIEVGHGLEGALTDITSSRIINDTIAPLFKQGDFYGGINAGLDQMIRVIDGEAAAGARPGMEARGADGGVCRGRSADRRPRRWRRFCDRSSGAAPAAGVAGLGGAGLAYWVNVATPAVDRRGRRSLPARAACRLRSRLELRRARRPRVPRHRLAADSAVVAVAAAAVAVSAAVAAVSEAAAPPAAGS